MQGFADEINGSGKSIADGREGRTSLLLSNAIYLSSWEKKMVDIPKTGSKDMVDSFIRDKKEPSDHQ